MSGETLSGSWCRGASSVRWLACLAITALVASRPLLAVELGGPVPDFALPVLINAQQQATVAPYPRSKLSDHLGSAIYLDFWSSACLPCRDSLPTLTKLRQRFDASELAIVSVNLDPNPNDALHFLTRYPVNFAVVSDPSQRLAEVYDVKGLPTAFFISRDGRLLGRHEGFRNGDLERLNTRLTALVKKSVDTSGIQSGKR